MARIDTLLDDSNLGLSVDLLAYSHIHYAPLKRHIDHNARQLFTHAEIKAGFYAP